MSIYGIGFDFQNRSVWQDFLDLNIVATDWTACEHPEFHKLFWELKPGDIVYLKKAYPAIDIIEIYAVGIVRDDAVFLPHCSSQPPLNLGVEIARNVFWLKRSVDDKTPFKSPKKPQGEHNNRFLTIYKEWDASVCEGIFKVINGGSLPTLAIKKI